jgi:2-iminobutanoate/2-iminopropanoate deaminase
MQNRIAATLLLVLLVGAAPAQERKVISPPEFGAQGSDRIPFSPGILQDGTLYVSGEIGADLKTRKIPADFETEVRTCLENIPIILKAAGMDYSNVVTVQVYLTDMSLFTRMNKVYAEVFKAPRPTRTTVGVTALAVPEAHVEMTVIARK